MQENTILKECNICNIHLTYKLRLYFNKFVRGLNCQFTYAIIIAAWNYRKTTVQVVCS